MVRTKLDLGPYFECVGRTGRENTPSIESDIYVSQNYPCLRGTLNEYRP